MKNVSTLAIHLQALPWSVKQEKPPLSQTNALTELVQDHGQGH